MNIIAVLVEVVIFVSLIGTIANSISTVGGNVTGTSLVLVGLITLFVTIGFVVALAKTMGLNLGTGRK